MPDETRTPRIIQTNSGERRGVERRFLTTEEQIAATKDWLRTQRKKVEKGILAQDECDELIARSMVARDRLTERSNEKRRKDPMTGLLNKGAYIEEYKRMAESGSPFGFMILDIDHFKSVNDNHGHDAGDSVLIQIAKDLTANLRQLRPEDAGNDMIFRYGGEEVVILLPTVTNKESLEIVAEKLRTKIESSPYSVMTNDDEKKVPITVSIGAGIFRQGESTDAEVFFRKVDKEGLYRAKEEGRNRTVIVSA